MSTQDKAAVDQAALDAVRAEGHTAGLAEGNTAGVAAGVTAERTRIAAILGSDEAKDRPALAQHLAMNTAMSPDDAKSTLAASAKEVAAATSPKSGASFEDAMDGSDHPAVGAGAPKTGADAEVDDGSDVIALAASAGLKGFARKPVAA